jgi:phage terminase large subunit
METGMAQVELRDSEQQALFEIWEAVHDDPGLFFVEILRVDRMRSWQRDVCGEIHARLDSGDRHLKILLRTCHGAGKGFLAAGLVLWLLSTRPNSRILTLAQTWDGVENLLWPEIASHYQRSLLRYLNFGRMLTTKLDVSDTWYALGSSSDKPEHLEGHHSKVAAMRVVDEAKAVETPTFDSTKGMLDAPETVDLWMSTPSIQSGEFFDRDTGSDESVIRRVVDVDELIADGVEGKAEWKEECRRDWGEHSDKYQSRVLAKYIDQAEGTLFPVSWIERAMAQTFEVATPLVAGMDVAGSVDGDQNAVAIVAGPDVSAGLLHVRSIDGWHERDTMVSKGKALSIVQPLKAPLYVDVIGLGKGVADAARQDGWRVSEYRASDKPRVPVDFLNRKAEDAWTLRERLEKGTVRLPFNQLLKAQMKDMKYRILPSGKKQVIDPAKSPDLADAVIIAIASAGGPAPIRFEPVASGFVTPKSLGGFG